MIYKKIALNMAIFSNVTEETAKEFIDHRINIKKPLTQGAFDRSMGVAVKCERLGISADEAVLMTVDKAWQGVTYEYIAAEISRRMAAITQSVAAPRLQQQKLCDTTGAPRSTRERTIQQDLNDRSWAD